MNTDVVGDFFINKENECCIKIVSSNPELFKSSIGAQIILDTVAEMLLQYYNVAPDELTAINYEGMH